MTVVLGLVVGALTVQLLRVGARGMMSSPTLARANYRGHVLPTGGGVLIVLAVIVIEAGRAGLGALGVGESTDLTIERSEVLFAVVAFGLLGLIDDLLGDGDHARLQGPRPRAASTVRSPRASSSCSVARPSPSSSSRRPGSPTVAASSSTRSSSPSPRTSGTCSTARRGAPSRPPRSPTSRSRSSSGTARWVSRSRRRWARRSGCSPTTSASDSCSGTRAPTSSARCSAWASCWEGARSVASPPSCCCSPRTSRPSSCRSRASSTGCRPLRWLDRLGQRPERRELDGTQPGTS